MAGKELTVPDWLKAKIEEGVIRADASKVITTIDSVPRISLKARKFNFIEGGEVTHKENDRIHVVIVGVQPENGMAKTFYHGKYEPGDTSPPDCSSFDGVRPDSWISVPVSENCAICPNNKWGSAVSMSGGKAKACRDSKRLIVVNAKNIKEGTAFVLNVTVASLKNLSNYGKELAKQGVPLESVITTVSIDEDSDFSMLEFTAAGVLKETEGMLAIGRANEKAWESGIDTTPAITDQSSSAPPQPEAAPAAPPAAAATPPAAGELVVSKNEDIDELISNW